MRLVLGFGILLQVPMTQSEHRQDSGGVSRSAHLVASDDVTENFIDYDDTGEEVEGPDKKQETGMPVNCSTLLPGQFLCDEHPDVDPDTQQPRGCNPETGKAKGALKCRAATGLLCAETQSRVFYQDVDCKWTNGYYFDTALLLSIFLGMFGADRFYLGYPALGLLKFSTLGFFFLGHLLDVILIATQVVGPADKSYYVISYFGPAVNILATDNATERRPQSDWF